MEVKKTPRADINRYSSLFLWLGLVFTLFVIWRFIEYKQYEKDDFKDEKWVVNADELEQNKEVKVEQPKIEQQQQKKAPPAEVKKVKDEEKVENIQFESSETDEEEAIDEPEEIQTEEPEEEEVNIGFKFVESAPVFPGCEKYEGNKEKLKKCMSRKIEKFVKRNFNKDIASDIGATGVVRVMVVFIVDKNGKISKIQAMSPYQELKDEAVRVIRSLPKMKPGKQRGKPVNVMYQLPIVFRVD